MPSNAPPQRFESYSANAGYHSRNGNSQVVKVGLAPAQDPHPLNTELTAQAEELFATFSIECVRILSGGKPTFPTCEFPYLEQSVLALQTTLKLCNQLFRTA